jgi:hypothetical protein
MYNGNEKKFKLTNCLFKNCYSIGVGGGVGDIFNCDFILSDCEFLSCSEGKHDTSSTASGGCSFIYCKFLF